MTLFKDYQQFAFTTLKENLVMAQHCINTPKEPGTESCYGMSALILLASNIDIIGNFYHDGKFSPTWMANKQFAKSHYEEYYNKFLNGLCDRTLFLNSFYNLSRCKAIHNGVLGQKVFITINQPSSGAFIQETQEVTYIYLNELYKIVDDSVTSLIKESGVEYQSDENTPITGRTY